MRITLAREGKTYVCELPYETCGYVIVHNMSECPLCVDLIALERPDGAIEALAPQEKLAEAQADYPQTVPREYGGVLQLFMPNPSTQHDRYTGAAECLRCRQVVGQMTVKVNTLFGIEEDRRVLVNGRARVY